MWETLVPNIVLVLVCSAIFLAERLRPGRNLPEAPGWYLRAILFNMCALFLLATVGSLFDTFFRLHSVLQLRELNSTALELVILVPAWSFVFYWWHRAAHLDGLWHFFHQMHHSPSRIETATTFYKHPVETIFEITLTATIIYLFLGASPLAGAWLGAMVGMVGFFSHANLKTPIWIGYIIQRPEQHSIHHQLDLHRYNYADFILWDRVFGTFKEAQTFTERCGFPKNNEARIAEMLRFKDVYHD